MKKSLLAYLILSNIIYADTPSSVVIDGVEYAPVPKQENNATQTYTIPQSSLQGVEDCWYEEVVITEPSDNSVNVGGAIVGGIIGGVIGHQFGSGSGNTAATIGGAAIGTALGANANGKPTQRTQMVRKCNTAK
jgi:uncharacterized protein YcfJ